MLLTISLIYAIMSLRTKVSNKTMEGNYEDL